MERKPDDSERDLKRDPYERPGFDNKLKRRIHDRIDRESRLRRRWAAFALRTAATAVVLTVGMQLLWIQPSGEHDAQVTASSPAVSAASAMNEPTFRTAPPSPSVSVPRSALLLGLRKGSGSTLDDYRTLLIAPVDRQVQIAAQGKGILVPYGQQFWEIEPVWRLIQGKTYQFLVAHPADEAGDWNDGTQPVANPAHRENLLFAGNRYLSMQTEDGTAAHYRVATFKDIRQPDVEAYTSGAVPAIGLSYTAATGSGQQPAASDSGTQAQGRPQAGGAPADTDWAVLRAPGHWEAEPASALANGQAADRGTAISALPEWLTAYDTLNLSLDRIRQTVPQALDAFMAPTNDLVAVRTPNRILVYRYNGKLAKYPDVTIRLDPSETVVSDQWATNQYIDKWIRLANVYLSNDGHSGVTLQP